MTITSKLWKVELAVFRERDTCSIKARAPRNTVGENQTIEPFIPISIPIDDIGAFRSQFLDVCVDFIPLSFTLRSLKGPLRVSLYCSTGSVLPSCRMFWNSLQVSSLGLLLSWAGQGSSVTCDS